MASEQWLLNDTNVAGGAYFTAVGSSYKLKNNNQTRSRTTSSPTPYEGAGCYLFTTNNTIREIQTSANAAVNGAKFVDYYVYVPANLDVVDYQFMLCANDGAVEYSWAAFFEDGSIGFGSYDSVNGLVVTRVSSAGAITVGAWNRLAAKSDTYGVLELKAFRGSNINGSTADTTITSASYSSYGFSTYVSLGVNGGPNVTFFPYADDIKFDDAAYPTRGTAYTASASSTITATGTASLTKTLTGSATGTETATGTGSLTYTANASASSSITATGTAAATKTVSIAASATITATGTAAASSTQALAATSSITATGTAAASTTSPIAITASSSITASGTSAANTTQTLAGSGTASASGAADSTKTFGAAATSTITATGIAVLALGRSLTASATGTVTVTGSASLTQHRPGAEAVIRPAVASTQRLIRTVAGVSSVIVRPKK